MAVDQVDDVRSLLRRGDAPARREALARIRTWEGTHLDPDAAAAVLRAVTVAHRWVPGERVDPADALVRVLWTTPRAVSVDDVEAAYLVSGERVRRSLLRLLALRRDARGRSAVEFLLGPDGPVDLLPAATSALLDPLLELDDLGRLPAVLAGVVGHPGWAWHGSDLLRRLVVTGRLDGDELDDVVDRLDRVVVDLVDAVDRAQPARALDHGPGGDLTRDDRHRLGSVVRLLESAATPASTRLLYRVLSSADPRVQAVAAVALVAQSCDVAPERLDLVARDAESRSLLLEGLDDLGRTDVLRADLRTGRTRAEADLVRWLAGETELGSAPDEVEHLATLPAPVEGRRHPSSAPSPTEASFVELFRFRLRAPHWSSARGWMVGAAGSYSPDGRRAGRPFAHSLYRAEDELSPAGHLAAIRIAVVDRTPPG